MSAAMGSQRMRFTAHQLTLGWREVRRIPKAAVILTAEHGRFVVRVGTVAKEFSRLEVARLHFDSVQSEEELAGLRAGNKN